MKYTNVHGLPMPVAQALAADPYHKHGDYSVTELINPPQISILKQRHDDEITVDVMQRVWTMRGSAMHYVMSLVNIPGAIVEERFMIKIEVDGVTYSVSMQPDYIYPDPERPEYYVQLDFKDAPVYKIKHKSFDDWEKQGNMYRYGAEQRGFQISRVIFVPILKDWKYTEAFVKKVYQYPKVPITPIEVNLWDMDFTLDYMKKRIAVHAAAKKLPDHQLPECTLDERYGTSDCFAVVFTKGKSKGNAVPKGASFETEAQARLFMNNRKDKKGNIKDDVTIEYRKGENKRCERGYCDAVSVCHQFKTKIRKDPF